MSEQSEIVQFYQTHLPEAKALPKGAEAPTWLRAQCPFCKGEAKGILNVDLDPESLFFGLFNCSALCSPPGYVLELCRRMGISLSEVPPRSTHRRAYIRSSWNPEDDPEGRRECRPAVRLAATRAIRLAATCSIRLAALTPVL